MLYSGRVVREDLAPDPVLERRDDLAARGVVLRVCGKDEQHVQGEADGVAFDLDVAFLHDVEQPHLDLAGEVGQLVDGEDAAVRARQQSVVDGELVRQEVAAARGLDRIQVADHVGDGHVGGGQLLHVAAVPRDPLYRGPVSVLLQQLPAVLGDGVERIVVHLAPGEDGDLLVEQCRQRAQDAALRLTPQAEQDEVVARQNGVDHLRHHGILEPDYAGEDLLLRLEHADEVVPHLVLDGAEMHPGLAPFGVLEVGQSRGLGHGAPV